MFPSEHRVRCDQTVKRRITQAEYDIVVNYMVKIGLTDGFMQELSSAEETYIPKFDLSGVPGKE